MNNRLHTSKDRSGAIQFAKGLCIVTFPLEQSAQTALSDLIDVLYPRSRELYVLSGGQAEAILEGKGLRNVVGVRHTSYTNRLRQAVSYALTNIKFLVKVIELREKVDIFIFFVGAESLLVPMLGAKIIGAKTILVPASDPGRIASSRGNKFGSVLSMLTISNFFLADFLILYSEEMIADISVERYRHKLALGHQHFIDFDEFVPIVKLQTRSMKVGFVGRLDREKGILNLIQAIPFVLDQLPIEFVICGDGPLHRQIEDNIISKGLSSSVRMEGWVSHEALPRYFNELKLLVLPSYTEGLPNVVLEAMACGTPVLMSRVGSLDGMAVDGRDIFFLDSNDPRIIAEKIISILNDPSKLSRVSNLGLDFVRSNFSYGSTSLIWDSVLSSLGASTT